MKSVFVSGLSGVGESTLSFLIQDRGYAAYDIEEMGWFSMFNVETGEELLEWDNADIELVKKMSWVCDAESLAAHIRQQQGDVAYYCGASSNVAEIGPLFDQIVLLTADEATIRQRLSTRTNNDFGRVREAQDLVLDGKETYERHLTGMGAVVVNANAQPDHVADEVIRRTAP
jgi:broad-specificity NMP kinase